MPRGPVRRRRGGIVVGVGGALRGRGGRGYDGFPAGRTGRCDRGPGRLRGNVNFSAIRCPRRYAETSASDRSQAVWAHPRTRFQAPDSCIYREPARQQAAFRPSTAHRRRPPTPVAGRIQGTDSPTFSAQSPAVGRACSRTRVLSADRLILAITALKTRNALPRHLPTSETADSRQALRAGPETGPQGAGRVALSRVAVSRAAVAGRAVRCRCAARAVVRRSG